MFDNINARQRQVQSLFLQAVSLLHPEEEDDDEEGEKNNNHVHKEKEEDDATLRAQAAILLHDCIALLSSSSTTPTCPYPATLDNPTHLHYCALLELGRLFESFPSLLPTSSLASSFYRRAVALATDRVEPLLLLGVARKREGGREEGINILREAVRKAKEREGARRSRRDEKKRRGQGVKEKKKQRRESEDKGKQEKEEEEEEEEEEVAREDDAGRQAMLELAVLLLQSAADGENGDGDEDGGGQVEEMKQKKNSSISSSRSRSISHNEQEADSLLHTLSFTYRLSTSIWSYPLSFPPPLPLSRPPTLPSSSFLHLSDGVLPPSLLGEMRRVFCPPSAPFWEEHGYYREGCAYFSYLMKLEGKGGIKGGKEKGLMGVEGKSGKKVGKVTKKQQQQQQQQDQEKKGMNAVEATVHYLFLHLLPFLPPALVPPETKKGGRKGGRGRGRGLTHAEWWCHTREEGSGHALHFDTDERAIREEGEGRKERGRGEGREENTMKDKGEIISEV